MNNTERGTAGGLLLARAEDMMRRAEAGAAVCGAFLTEAEQHTVSAHFAHSGGASRVLFWGGYPDAERKKAFYLPDWLEIPEEPEPAFFVEYYSNPMQPIIITASGYCGISHRDYLGVVLALGIDREAVGDIRTCDSGAVLFCDAAVGGLILSELRRVGADTVKASLLGFAEACAAIPRREYEEISDTIPSARLDAVVGSVCRMAREKAKNAVEAKNVVLNGATETRPDAQVREGDVISVRSCGKFRIVSCTEKNRHDRIRLKAEKFI